MSVILNEAALTFLLESEGGPVGLDLRRRSENVTVLYKENIREILPEFFDEGGDVTFAIETTDAGLQSTIGINPGDSESSRMGEYLARKVEREPEKAANAIAQGLHT